MKQLLEAYDMDKKMKVAVIIMTVSVRSVLSVPLLSASIRRRNGGLSRTAAIRSMKSAGSFLPMNRMVWDDDESGGVERETQGD